MKRIIIIEEDDDGKEIGRREMPYVPSWQDGYTCPICGKHVGSMEVHPCNQPWCRQTRDDGWFPGGAAWDECNQDNMPKWKEEK